MSIKPPSFFIHHIGVRCRSVEESRRFYVDSLGSEITTCWRAASGALAAFVGRGSDVTIQLIEPSFAPYVGRPSAPGVTINHLSFLVDDVHLSFEYLKDRRVQIAWEPADLFDITHFGAFDPDGVLFEFYETKLDRPLPTPALEGPTRLHHVSLLTPDLRKTERFLTDTLHMRTVIEHTQNDGGFIFMVDQGFDQRAHNFMLEVIGPPRARVDRATALLEPREQLILDQRGACLDHFCFIDDDVPEAHRSFVRRGATAAAEPYRDYGSWISWLKDPDGNDVELMSPIPEAIVHLALARKRPIQTIKVNFDAGKEELHRMSPPWQGEQIENLNKQR